jgi:hypothetical protein
VEAAKGNEREEMGAGFSTLSSMRPALSFSFFFLFLLGDDPIE